MRCQFCTNLVLVPLMARLGDLMECDSRTSCYAPNTISFHSHASDLMSNVTIKSSTFHVLFIHSSFIHSIGMCRMRRLLPVLRNFFHSSLLCTFPCHLSPLTILPSPLTSSCHLFLGLTLNHVVPKFIYNIYI